MDKTDPRLIGVRIRAVMRKLDLQIDDLAQELKVHRNAVSNWIHGYNQPKIELAYKLIKLLPGLTLEWIYLGDDQMVPGPLARELSILIVAHEQGLELPASEPEPEAPRPSPAKTRYPAASRRLASAGG